MEGSELTPYLDTEGVPTIGIGLNLQTSEAQTYMRNYFGFDLGDPDDLAYWGQIVIELSITQPSTAALQSSLDAIMAARALHFGAGSTTFAFADEADNLTAFNARIQSYETSTGSYYSSTGVPAYSWERLALVSLKYQGVVGPSMRSFMVDGNRAEAWAEIRYFSNGTPGTNVAKRRFTEAAMFGLFEGATPTEQEVEDAARMFQRRRVDIEDYETAESSKIGAANADLSAANITAYSVAALADELAPVKDFFQANVSALAPQHSTAITAAFGATAPTDIFVGERGETNTINSGLDAATGLARTSADLIVGQDFMDNLSAGKNPISLSSEAQRAFAT